MALGKQAKILSDKQVRAVLAELETRRYPLRDRVMFLLSIKAGIRANEIASVTWANADRCRGRNRRCDRAGEQSLKGQGWRPTYSAAPRPQSRVDRTTSVIAARRLDPICRYPQ